MKYCDRCNVEKDEWMNVKYDDDGHHLETVCLTCELPDDYALTKFLRNEFFVTYQDIDDYTNDFFENLLELSQNKKWSVSNTTMLSENLKNTLYFWVKEEANGGNNEKYLFGIIWKIMNGEKIISRADRFEKLDCSCGEQAKWYDKINDVYLCDDCIDEII